MIQAPAKPTKTIQVGTITVELDEVYEVEITKTMDNGSPATYEAKLISHQECDYSVKMLVEKTVISNFQKNGLWG
jgi:hypothetical protein